ncbi:MAG: PDZ domain-containing protein [Gemmatimonadales bacterium]|nr:PDZ domain-containing protein [Gemmatimonadales bacterium]
MNHVDSVTTRQLVRAAIDGMLGSLDPHSYFLAREDADRLLAWRAGELAATGIILETIDDTPTVHAVYPRSPADKAGISPGDRLVAIDDSSVSGVTTSVIRTWLLGTVGKQVTLSLERGSVLEPDTLRVRLKYQPIKPVAIAATAMADDSTGYIRLQEFTGEAAKELEKAVQRLVGSRKAKHLILDLRGNPGGSLEAAVAVASLFLPKDVLVFEIRGRSKRVDQAFRTSRDGKFRSLPLMLLIDEQSASASEVVGGSLQDHDRALILGRRSFGKALVQLPFGIPPAGDAVWLTIGYVLTPSGRLIQRRYEGMSKERYYSLAGRGGSESDTLDAYVTTSGRRVEGRGGIAPDIEFDAPPSTPVWLSVASDSSFDHAIADSVAHSLSEATWSAQTWANSASVWEAELLPPFLRRVRARLGVAARTTPGLDRAIARQLAARVAEVRWGSDARDELLLRSDLDVSAALEHIPRLESFLRRSGSDVKSE